MTQKSIFLTITYLYIKGYHYVVNNVNTQKKYYIHVLANLVVNYLNDHFSFSLLDYM